MVIIGRVFQGFGTKKIGLLAKVQLELIYTTEILSSEKRNVQEQWTAIAVTVQVKLYCTDIKL